MPLGPRITVASRDDGDGNGSSGEGDGGGEGGPAGDAGPAAHWPQVRAQLLWNQGRSHLCVFFSHHVLGLMSWHRGGGGSGGGGGGGSGGDTGPAGDAGPAAHWPQVIAQLLWNQGRSHLYVFFSHHVLGLINVLARRRGWRRTARNLHRVTLGPRRAVPNQPRGVRLQASGNAPSCAVRKRDHRDIRMRAVGLEFLRHLPPVIAAEEQGGRDRGVRPCVH